MILWIKFEHWNWWLDQQREHHQNHQFANQELKDQHWLKKYLKKINCWFNILLKKNIWRKSSLIEECEYWYNMVN